MVERITKRRRKRSTRKQRIILMTMGCSILAIAAVLIAIYIKTGNVKLRMLSLSYVVLGSLVMMWRSILIALNTRNKRRCGSSDSSRQTEVA